LSNVVHVDVFRQQARVPCGKATVFAHLRIQRTHDQVFDFFFFLVDMVQQAGGIRTSSKQTVPLVQWVHQLVTFHDTFKLGIDFLTAIVLVFPHFHHLVSLMF
jgi:hypothetical protein